VFCFTPLQGRRARSQDRINKEELEMSDTTFTFSAPDHVEVFVRRWTPDSGAVKAAVQVVHGAAEYSRRYERFAHFLNAAGLVVYASDHRGHGETAQRSGKLGVGGEDAWSGMVKDQKQLTDIIRKDNPNLPIFLFGHSMGSMIAQDYSARWGTDLRGVVLSGTAGLFPNLDALVAMAEQAAQGAAAEPSAVFGQMFASFNTPFAPAKTGFEWLSRDEAEVQKYADDPWCGFPFSNGLVRDFMKGLRDMWQPDKEACIPKDLPILIVSGSLDPVGGNTQAVMPLIERYRSNGIQDLAYRFYPEARHEILNEVNRDKVQQGILDWLNTHLP
jgi:alpha-beta hydrolase superfamily lysophospholipase